MAQTCQISNNSAADCSISVKFCTEFEHVTSDATLISRLRSTGQRPRSQCDYLSVVKRYKSGTNRLTDFKLDENYPVVEHNMWHIMFKVIMSNTENAKIYRGTRIARFRLVR